MNPTNSPHPILTLKVTVTGQHKDENGITQRLNFRTRLTGIPPHLLLFLKPFINDPLLSVEIKLVDELNPPLAKTASVGEWYNRLKAICVPDELSDADGMPEV